MIRIPGIPTPEQVAAKLPPGTFDWRGDDLHFDCPHCGAERAAFATSYTVRCGMDCSTHEGLLNAIGIDPTALPVLAAWEDGPLPEWWTYDEFDTLLGRTKETSDVAIRDDIIYRVCPVCSGNRLLFNEILPPRCGNGCSTNQIFSAVGMTIEPPKLRRFVSARELLTATLAAVAYLIQKLIEQDTTGVVFGPSGEGKTFIALDFALCVATGTPWNGRKVKRGLVLYLAGEGHGGITRRVRAWAKHHSMTAEDLALFHVSRRTIAMNGDGLEDVAAEARDLAEQHGVPVAMIVVDTLARHIEGHENDAGDMGVFIKSVDWLRASFAGCVAMIVHHTGHAQDAKTRGRGHSSLKAAADFEFLVDAGVLRCTKMKDGNEPDPMEFKLQPVEIGTDDDGEPITSCFVEYGERSERNKTASFTPTEKTAIRALITASAKHRIPNGADYGCLVGDWRDAFYEARRADDPDIKQHAMKTAFQRAQASLVEKRVVIAAHNARFLTAEDHQREIAGLIPPETAHGTKTAQNGLCAGHQVTAHGTLSLRECADVPPDVPPPNSVEWVQAEVDL